MRENPFHQHLPSNWAKREALREKGQFWTPSWIAEAMVAYAIKDSNLLFDPAVGNGAFYAALKNICLRTGKNVDFFGTDIDENLISKAQKEGIFNSKLTTIEIRDFILDPPDRLFKSIVANPPYIRHHRLSPTYKAVLKKLSFRIMNDFLDGRAGLHIYFLLQALNLLEDEGKLSFIMPADTCEGVFANKLWKWIAMNYSLECVVTFEHDATPFPGVDVNAVVFMIKKSKPKNYFYWLIATKSCTEELTDYVLSDFSNASYSTLKITCRNLEEALKTGLTRAPNCSSGLESKLGDFASVMRGIATGANEFFFLTEQQIEDFGIPREFLVSAIGRTRDIDVNEINQETMLKLKLKGRPTLLFSPDGRRIENFPISVQKYIRYGESLGINKRALVATRNPWYKMEKRKVPPILFAYLGRRNARFIRNFAGVIPLTGFLCVYPRSKDPEYLEKIWFILQQPETIENLKLVGKSYGESAIKVEPRALEKLPLPKELIEKTGLSPKKEGLLHFL